MTSVSFRAPTSWSAYGALEILLGLKVEARAAVVKVAVRQQHKNNNHNKKIIIAVMLIIIKMIMIIIVILSTR